MFIFRLLEGKKVVASDYNECLKELANICMLCNDSGLAYNEVWLKSYKSVLIQYTS